jgi:hypothetical protein
MSECLQIVVLSLLWLGLFLLFPVSHMLIEWPGR